MLYRKHVIQQGGLPRRDTLQSAELGERNVAPGKFDPKRTAVARRPKKNGLLLQLRAGLATFEIVIDDAADLIGFVTDGDEPRFRTRCLFGPEILGEALPTEVDILRLSTTFRRHFPISNPSSPAGHSDKTGDFVNQRLVTLTVRPSF
jgi:hypothetical protein